MSPVVHDVVFVQFTQLQVFTVAACVFLASLLAMLLFGCDKDGNLKAK